MIERVLGVTRLRVAPTTQVGPTLQGLHILIAFSQFAETRIRFLLSLLEHILELVKLVNVLSVLSLLDLEDHPLLPDDLLLLGQFVLLVQALQLLVDAVFF